MIKLPATIQQAEALTFALEAITRQREPGGIFTPDADILYGKLPMKQWALFSAFGCDEIVYFAEKGSKEADLALREIIAEKSDRDEPLTAVLRAYNIRLLNPARQRQHGPGRAQNFVRDMGIVFLVTALIDRFGLSPTGRSDRQPSASSIAAQALTDAGLDIPLGRKGVEKIWQRYLPAFAGSHYAARSRFAIAEAAYGGPGIFDK